MKFSEMIETLNGKGSLPKNDVKILTALIKTRPNDNDS